MKSMYSLALLLVGLSLAPAQASRMLLDGSSSGPFTGDGTAFSDAVTDGKGFACSYRALNSWSQRQFAAINSVQWQDGKACGKCVSVECIDSRCPTQNKPVKMLIVDLCPECSFGALDLSYPAYKEVTGSWPHRLQVKWDFVDCGDDMEGTIQMHPKDGINANWSAFYFSNSRSPLVSVSVNGFELARQTYNFWVHSAPLGSAPYNIVFKSESGETLTATVDDMLKAQDLNIQFGSSSGGSQPAAAG